MTFEREFEESIKTLSERFREILPWSVGRDDVGLVKLDEDELLLVNVDKTSSRPIGLELGIMDWYEYGRYAVFQNITDILSSSGTPIAFALLLQLPEKNSSIFQQIMNGILSELKRYNITFLGGDTKPGKSVSIVGTMLGITTPNKYSPRWRAKPGDLVYLTGFVGLFSLAGYMFSKKLLEKCKAERKTLEDFILRPKIPFEEAKIIIQAGASAGIDISDGLSVDLYKICHESKVDIAIYLDKIPIHPTLSRLSNLLRVDPYRFIFNVGGDWQIVYTVPKTNARLIEDLKKKFHMQFPIQIGKVARESLHGKVEVYKSSGEYLGILKERGHLSEFENIPFTEEIALGVDEDVLS